jgi:hypothetical protein
LSAAGFEPTGFQPVGVQFFKNPNKHSFSLARAGISGKPGSTKRTRANSQNMNKKDGRFENVLLPKSV